MTISAQIVKDLAPTGKLRASINVGNPILAKRDGPNATPYGVSIDLAQQLAKELETKAALNSFKTRNEISDPARYPSDQLVHFSLLILFVAIFHESALIKIH